MLLRKTSWFWKSGLAAISFVLILSISGGSDAPPGRKYSFGNSN